MTTSAPIGSVLQNRGLTQLAAQGIFEESVTAKHALGERLRVGDRTFHYCKASEALAAGDIISSIGIPMHEDTLTAAVAVGIKKVTITEPNSSAYVANYFQEGYLVITAHAGEGITYKISGHAAIVQAATWVCNLYDGILVALTTATDVTVYTSPYYVQVNNDEQEQIVGVAPIAITSGYFFWGVTYGPAAVKATAIGASDDERLLVANANAIAQHTAGMPIFGEAVLDAGDYTNAVYQLVMVKAIA